MGNKIVQKQLLGEGSIFIEGVIQEAENPITASNANHCNGDCTTCSKYPKRKRSSVNSATYYKRYQRAL